MIKMISNLNPEPPDKYIYIYIYIYNLSTIYKRGFHPLESEWRMKIISLKQYQMPHSFDNFLN